MPLIVGNMPTLLVDYVSNRVAKYACTKWHYSKTIPVNKIIRFGVWEDEHFVGVILFGCGASSNAHQQYKILPNEMCELVRVALRRHTFEVTRMISVCLRLLKKTNPKLRLVTSFADPDEGHHGGIYQGGNWIYTGISANVNQYHFNGAWRHCTDVYKRLSPDQCKLLPKRLKSGKHRYLMPLDGPMRAFILPLKQPFIKRVKQAMGDTITTAAV